jgi:hypothetical protein
MLTIFSIPKAFVGHIGVIQRNALGSWMRLGHGVQVILYGNEKGIADAAHEVGADHVPDIQRSEYGTPLVSSAFSMAASMARNSLLCYVNGDMMFTDELIRAAASIRKWNFLMVGQRWNVDITEPWEFSDPQWREKLLKLTRDHGTLYSPYGIDYFVFPRDSKLTDLPPFAVGRPHWDNYVLFRCRQLGYPLIDATEVVTAVHQNHDYAHVPKGTGPSHLPYGRDGGEANNQLLGNEPRQYDLVDATPKLTKSGLKQTTNIDHWRRYLSRYPSHLPYGPEGEANNKLLGGDSRQFCIMNATHKLTKSGLEKTTGIDHWRRYLSTYSVVHPHRRISGKAVVGIKTILRWIRVLLIFVFKGKHNGASRRVLGGRSDYS